MLKYKENPVVTFGYPERGKFVVDLTKPEDPDIPEFVLDQIRFYKGIVTMVKDNHLTIMDPKYLPGRPASTERIVFIKEGNAERVIREGEVATVRFSMTSVTFEEKTTYGYALSI